MDIALLAWGFLFSSIGLAFFMYGKSQKSLIPLCSGLVLMIYPYFVSSSAWMVVIGAILSAIPYFVRL
jgi:hypothetical protein